VYEVVFDLFNFLKGKESVQAYPVRVRTSENQLIRSGVYSLCQAVYLGAMPV
jgi:hypothetical protein